MIYDGKSATPYTKRAIALHYTPKCFVLVGRNCSFIPHVYVYCFSLNLIIGARNGNKKYGTVPHAIYSLSSLSLESTTPTYNRGRLIHLLFFFFLVGFHFTVQELKTLVANTTPGFFTGLDVLAQLFFLFTFLTVGI
jgi:hypothetical protein